MPPRIGLIPVVRVVATHRSVTAAVEAMLSVRRIGVAEESVGIQEDGRDAWMVIINGETESRSRIDKAAGFLRGWCEAKRIEAEILLPPRARVVLCGPLATIARKIKPAAPTTGMVGPRP